MRNHQRLLAVLSGVVLWAGCERDPTQPVSGPRMAVAAAGSGMPSYAWAGMWGTTGSGPGEFRQPRGVAVASKVGSVYVADMLNFRVQVFGPTGDYVGAWESFPFAIAVAPRSGKVYVLLGSNVVVVHDAAGTFLTFWGSTGSGPGQFVAARGIAVAEKTGRVYVADWLGQRIQVFDSAGTYLTEWGVGQFWGPYGIAVGRKSGNVYVTDTYNSQVRVFDGAGTPVTQWGGPGSAPGRLANPTGIALDEKERYAYVAEIGNSRIQVFDATGTYVTEWGMLGSEPGQFALPWAVAVADKTGIVYVADQSNNRVQMFTPKMK